VEVDGYRSEMVRDRDLVVVLETFVGAGFAVAVAVVVGVSVGVVVVVVVVGRRSFAIVVSAILHSYWVAPRVRYSVLHGMENGVWMVEFYCFPDGSYRRD